MDKEPAAEIGIGGTRGKANGSPQKAREASDERNAAAYRRIGASMVSGWALVRPENEYIAEFNKKFTTLASEEGTAFVKCHHSDLDSVFSIQSERIAGRDNTVKFKNMVLQIDKQSFRGSLANCRVIVHEHLDESITIGFGPHQVGRFSAFEVP